MYNCNFRLPKILFGLRFDNAAILSPSTFFQWVYTTCTVTIVIHLLKFQIRYEWVKELLPRLHQVDAYTLSGWSADDRDKIASESDSAVDDCVTQSVGRDNEQGNIHRVYFPNFLVN